MTLCELVSTFSILSSSCLDKISEAHMFETQNSVVRNHNLPMEEVTHFLSALPSCINKIAVCFVPFCRVCTHDILLLPPGGFHMIFYEERERNWG